MKRLLISAITLLLLVSLQACRENGTSSGMKLLPDQTGSISKAIIVPSDPGFNNFDRGYGIIENTTLSGGALRRPSFLFNFGLPTSNTSPVPTESWKLSWSGSGTVFDRQVGQSGVVYNGSILIIGGTTGAVEAASKKVFQLIPKSNGVIPDGNITEGEIIPSILTGHCSVVLNGRVYVIGGSSTVDGTSPSNMIYSAFIGLDGQPHAWAQQPGKFSTPRSELACVAYGGKLFIIGGKNASGNPYSDILMADVAEDGTVQQFTSAGSLKGASYGHSAFAFTGYLYIAGGCLQKNCTGISNKFDYYKIKGDGQTSYVGSVDLPNSEPLAYTAAMATFVSAASTPFIYIIGGTKTGAPTGATDKVYTAWMNPDGGLIQLPSGWCSGSSDPYWCGTTSLTTGREGHTALISGGTIYVLNGRDGTSMKQNEVLYIPINSDGMLGTTWAKMAKPTGFKIGAQAVTYNGMIYVTGGETTDFGQVYYTRLSPTGEIGPWKQGPSFPGGRIDHAVIASNDRLFVIGGLGKNDIPLGDIQVGTIDSDGNVTGWNQNPSTLSPARFGHAAAITNSFPPVIYVIGGSTDTNPTNSIATVEYAQVSMQTKTIGTWTTTTSIPAGRTNLSAIVSTTNSSSTLYAIGGDTGGISPEAQGSVYSATNPGGAITTWNSDAMPAGKQRTRCGIASQGGAVFIFGGNNGTTLLGDIIRYSNASWMNAGTLPTSMTEFANATWNGRLYVMIMESMWSAPFDTNGSTGPGFDLTPPNPYNLPNTANHASVVSGDYLYVLGGETTGGAVRTASTVVFGKMRTEGRVEWATSTYKLVPFVKKAAAVSVGGNLYVIGGEDSTDKKLQSVQSAPINPETGDITRDFANEGTGLLGEGRAGIAASVYNDYIYVSGGLGDSGLKNNVQRAKYSNGSLGAWETLSQVFKIARAKHSSFVFNGRLYIVGGEGPSGYIGWENAIEFAPINEDGTIGEFKSSPVPSGSGSVMFASGQACTVYNGYLYVVNPSVPVPASKIYRAGIGPDGMLGSLDTDWLELEYLQGQRKNHTTIAVNGFLYTLCGYIESTTSYLNDYIIAPLISQPSTSGMLVSRKYSSKYDGSSFKSLEINGKEAGNDVWTRLFARTAGDSGDFGLWEQYDSYKGVKYSVADLGKTGKYLELGVMVEDGYSGTGNGSSEINNIAVSYFYPNGSPCNITDECSSGFCVKNICCAEACNNTPSSCQEAGVCTGGVCSYPIKAGNCWIDNVCYNDKQANPSNNCAYCDVASPTAWTYKNNGDPCTNGDPCWINEHCDSSHICGNGTWNPDCDSDGGISDGGKTDGGSTDGGSADGGGQDGGADGGPTDGGQPPKPENPYGCICSSLSL